MKKVLPKQIGPYRILEELGEGGMGVVYLARQEEPVRRRVALKVIKLGMDTAEVIARFESERQALALMSHTHIAKVLDAGATEQGRPYFVMEPVAGLPITEYCDKHKLGIRERLDLFIQVCRAIHHAHQKGIIHRDVKPSNVLVSLEDGVAVPKVIDFGVAKATDQRLTEKTVYTQQGLLIGTPEYMSPEQAELGGVEVDTTTDVYSLGVLLYELLVGAVPFNLSSLSYSQIERTIREQEPPKLGTRLSSLGGRASEVAERRRLDIRSLARRLRGELNWIALKALEKERSRRYASASELAADVERYLKNEPVQARAPSPGYVLRKAVARNKLAVAAGVGFVVLLMAFGVAMALQARRVAREAERANRGEATAKQVSDFLIGLFEVSDPRESLGNTVTARELLDWGAQEIEKELGEKPIVQARLMHTIGAVYRRLGLYGEADPLLERALELREQELGQEHSDVAVTLNELAELRRGEGRYTDGELLLRRAVAIWDQPVGPNDLGFSTALNSLANIYWEQGKYSEAEPFYLRALAVREKALGSDHADVALSLNNLALLYWKQGRYTEAEQLFRRALAIREKELGSEHPYVSSTLTNLAVLYTERLGKYDEAESLQLRSLAIREKVLGSEHPSVAQSLTNLAELYRVQNRLAEAAPLLLRALAIREAAEGLDHPSVATVLTNLANVYTAQGRYVEAEPQYRRAVNIQEDKLGSEHPDLAWSLYSLANAYRDQGRLSESVPLYDQALTIREQAFGPDHPDVSETLGAYAALLRELGRGEEANALEVRIRERPGGAES